jgi:formylmethanofuran dehydrogenase subunit E
MESVETLLEECGRLHGHLCPGQLLGVRMSLLGCKSIGIDDPKGADRKKLIVWVEIDRCMADAVSAVTGARLGRRSLKFVDYGKVAATFFNSESREAVRVVALDSSRTLADIRFPEVESRKERQMRAYMSAKDNDLFKVERVAVNYRPNDAPGQPTSRVVCDRCGEGINDGREIFRDGKCVCRPCAGESYYSCD